MIALRASFSGLFGGWAKPARPKPVRVAIPSADLDGCAISHPVIRLEDAGLRIEGRALLEGLEAELVERRIAVIGRNGSGKSTFLRLVAGLVAPTEGRVTVNGKDPFRERRAMLSEIGILFQNPDHQILFPTVAQELAFGLKQQGATELEARDRVASLLAREGRSDWADRPTHLLSQGQRQYLCLMAVLLMRPATILLDEPYAGLDLPMRIRMERRLDTLKQQILIVTHDPRDARLCDRVIWIEAGRIVADGPPDRVLDGYVAHMTELGGLDADPDLPG